ncbi:NAD-dependent epimerase/dehydratase family protein [Imhoffiella purpurea]|uniref:NAD-dependent epimerase/dehydratase family protein n=1 Tax=Imhoffiella purpurea TaxID=1249627 RepID=UPI0005C2544A|nr:NAD-dependent epimerase/dehydratase family protein [Imhoffiella purpurea]
MTPDAASPLGKVLVTGATGRVGRALVAALLERRCPVAVLTRSPEAARRLWPDGAVEVRLGDLRDPESLTGVGEDIQTLFHLASYAPRPDEPDIYNAPDHWPVTAEGTRNLLSRLDDSPLERILYVSTIKAMGDRAGARGHPADEDTPAEPESLYGRAKLNAEQAVLAWGRARGIQADVLRLPMVYGLEHEGNIVRMIEAVAKGRFPPWPRIHNRRSAVHIQDAVKAALLIAERPQDPGETYCVTDGRAYSTRWIYERIRLALGRPIPAWTVPEWMLKTAAAAGSLIERLLKRRMPLTLEGLSKLTGDAWYSSVKLQRRRGFTPRHSLEDEIPRLVRRMVGPPSPGPAPRRGRSEDSG